MEVNRFFNYALDEDLKDLDISELVQAPLIKPKIRYRNLAVDDDLRAKLLIAVERVLKNGQLIMGPEVAEMENQIAKYCNVSHCIGVSSGTSAIYIALASKGIGPNDEVITTPMSAISTANAIVMTGAEPVFVDVGSDLNINVNLIEEAITRKTKAIVPVHYTGRLCNMDKIIKIANAHKLLVIEDASQAWGAKNHLGYAGAIGNAGAISISQMKILNSYGEAGIILTNNSDYAEKMIILRYLGIVNREVCVFPTLNHKIDTIQAAMLMAGFDTVDKKIERRLEIAMRYHEGMSKIVSCPAPPKNLKDLSCVFFDYTIQTSMRKELRRWMEDKGVEVKIRHPLTLADQPCLQHLPKRDLPMSSRLVHEILSLPIHEKMKDDEVDYVIEQVNKFFLKRMKIYITSCNNNPNASSKDELKKSSYTLDTREEREKYILEHQNSTSLRKLLIFPRVHQYRNNQYM